MLATLLLSLAFAADPYASFLQTRAMSSADEFAIGQSYSASEVWLTGTWKDPDQQLRVERIVRRLMAVSDRPDMVINVTLLDNPEINASAYPGGFLLVNRGILELLDDDQLAWVLGHELSHAILRHGADSINLDRAAPVVSSIEASRAAGDREATRARAKDLAILGADFSRQTELEADMFGMLYCIRAGYRLDATTEGMKQLRTALEGDTPRPPDPYSSHPTWGERISEIEKARAGVEKTFAQFEAGVTLMQLGHPQQAAPAFQAFLTLFPQSSAGWANLAAAFAAQMTPPTDGWMDVMPLHTSSGQRVRAAADDVAKERALEAVGHALKINPYDAVAIGVMGVIARREGRNEDAQALFERALGFSPDNPALQVDLGNALAAQGDDAKARKQWEQVRASTPLQMEPLINLARLAEQDKQKKQAIAQWTEVAKSPAWEREAREHLVGLGVKGIEAPPADTHETLSLDGTTLAVRKPASEATAALGEPSLVQNIEGGYQYLYWREVGAVAVVANERVIAWQLRSRGSTGKGITMGGSREDLTGAYGDPNGGYALGRFMAMDWLDSGISADLVDGKITKLGIFIRE